MVDLAEAVDHYVRELGGSRADDAFHSLVELGTGALPYICEALRTDRDRAVQIRLAQIVCHSRTPEALSCLRELLNDTDADIWKTALDGFVIIGGESSGREAALRILCDRRETAADDQREWIDEAIEQIRETDRPA
jgi:hypothetical protein